MKPILEVKNVSKRYKIRHQAAGYLSLRERLVNIVKHRTGETEDYFALKDVFFEVENGQSIGIIGRNGAGKSTLLKILSKITSPTFGKVIARGRIASLLEVGTGFHPELTGRENIFFNGSLLGMKRREIKNNFDAIVDFSSVERFLDTPLKHYSSGMQLRLAFAVAAFLEPEVLVIDEVLAVGDAEFQKKCLAKMEDVSRGGRTILFVSHQMSAVEHLCEKTILLENGTVKAMGKTGEVIKLYLNQQGSGTAADQVFAPDEKRFISRIELLRNNVHAEIFPMGSELEVRVHFKSPDKLEPLLGVIIYDGMGTPLIFFNNRNYGQKLVFEPVREGIISMTIPSLNLMPGFYSMDIHFASVFKDLDVKKNCFQFEIQYKHFSDSGEPLNEKFNRVYYKEIVWKFARGHA
jgi:lipopolysaccharide transport system ATP-binding protein